ncbi:hypothetical protein RCO48_33795 [Peribacillus frigoritolerans]|nr:hypothetical protein [Peribacillus frigoritolerans]
MDKLTLSNPDLTVNQAYEIQKLSINETITDDNRFIGWKMGLTSKAKQQQVGVEEAIYGRLTSAMELTKPVLKVGELIHPRVEPEFAFFIQGRTERCKYNRERCLAGCRMCISRSGSY